MCVFSNHHLPVHIVEATEADEFYSTNVGTEVLGVRNEPPRWKTNNVVSEQVRHKPGCTVTEAG